MIKETFFNLLCNFGRVIPLPGIKLSLNHSFRKDFTHQNVFVFYHLSRSSSKSKQAGIFRACISKGSSQVKILKEKERKKKLWCHTEIRNYKGNIFIPEANENITSYQVDLAIFKEC